MLARDRRVARALLYVALIVSGLAGIFVNISFAVSLGLKGVGAFLIVGGGICLVGHMRRILALEKLGLWLLITAMGALSLTAFVGGSATPPRYFIASLCTAFTFALFARWRDLQTLIRLNKSLASETK